MSFHGLLYYSTTSVGNKFECPINGVMIDNSYRPLLMPFRRNESPDNCMRQILALIEENTYVKKVATYLTEGLIPAGSETFFQYVILCVTKHCEGGVDSPSYRQIPIVNRWVWSLFVCKRNNLATTSVSDICMTHHVFEFIICTNFCKNSQNF